MTELEAAGDFDRSASWIRDDRKHPRCKRDDKCAPNPITSTGGFPAKRVIALRTGDVPDEKRIAWEYSKGTGYVLSNIVYGDCLYLLTDNGIVTCVDVATGAIKYEGGRPPRPARFFGSPVAFGGFIALTSEEGETYLVKAGPVFEIAQINSIGETVWSSPAIANGRIYIRGTIENNVIGDAAVTGSGSCEAFGIIVGAPGAGGSHTTLINDNQVRQYFDRFIVLEAGEGSAALNGTVTNNTVSNFADAINSLHGIHSDNGILGTDTDTVCLAISGNSVATAGNEAQGGVDIRVRKSPTAVMTVRLPGLVGSTSADATALLQANNPTATTVTVTGSGFSGGAACPLPPS